MEYRHGEILPSSNICVICMCYYGEVVCSTEKCPPLKIGCRRINTEETCCGKIVCGTRIIQFRNFRRQAKLERSERRASPNPGSDGFPSIFPVEADESPTVVLDRADATAPSLHQPIVSPDPFRDVIKTEPAPDLPSLIEDMIPYLVEHGITTPRSTTTTLKTLQTQGSNHQSSFDYRDKLGAIRPPYEFRTEDSPDRVMSKNKYGGNADASKDGVPVKSEAATELDYEKTVSSEIEHNAKDHNYTDGTNVSKLNNSRSNDTLAGSNPEEPMTKNSDSKVSSTTEDPDDLDESIFSLDSVFDLLFSKGKVNSEADTESTTAPSVSVATVKTTEEPKSSTESTQKLREPVPEAGTSSKVLENEIPASVASLLKLAGCNIYGRMYRVGRIITELSSPCLECRCTEIGVQCKQLDC